MTRLDQTLDAPTGRSADAAAEREPDPFETVQQIAGGYALARCLHAVADLGVADRLDDAPRTLTDLAAAAGADPHALGRVLRLLAAHGVFAVQGATVRHSPASQLLRTDHPQSLRAFVRLFGAPAFWQVYAAFAHAVRTGQPAATQALPEGLFAYFAAHPEEAATFDAAMAAKAQGHVAGILAAYDFSSFQQIGDIGGGRGHLLRAVLDAAPAATGVLFDLPHVIAEAEAAGVASDRLSVQAGDFFHEALPICDAYLLMEVLHDWDDDAAVALLRAVRRAAPAAATLLVLEQMLPADLGPAWVKTLDIHMLALLGGRQRTRDEYAALLAASGFALEREIDTGAGIAILEARPA